MKDVGDCFGAGELILPFVLQSAEVMKRAVAHLDKFLERQEGATKGQVVLATVSPAAEQAPAAAPGRRSSVRPAERPPAPPFWGPRAVPAGQVPLHDLWPHLDLAELFKLQWGVCLKGEEYEKRAIRDEFGPRLEQLEAEAQARGWLDPRWSTASERVSVGSRAPSRG